MVQYVDTVSNTTRGVLRVIRIIRRGIMIRRGEVIRRDRALRSVLPLSSFSSPMLRRGSNKPVQTLPLLQTHQCYPSLIYMYTHHTIYSYILTYTHINTNQSKPSLCSKHTGLLCSVLPAWSSRWTYMQK